MSTGTICSATYFIKSSKRTTFYSQNYDIRKISWETQRR